MDIQSALLIFAGIFNLGWIIFFLRFYFKGVNRNISNFFILNVVTVFLWIVTMFLYRNGQDDATILWMCKLLYVSAALIPVTLLYFAYFFPKGVTKYSVFKLIFIFLPTLIILYLTYFTDTIVLNAYRVENAEHFIVWGRFYFLYVIYIPLYFTWAFTVFIKKCKENTGLVRMQILYILIGVIISSTIAMITNLIMPSIYRFEWNWAGQVATVVWIAFTIYPIVRYRLTDVRIILRKLFMYTSLSVFVYVCFYILAWYYQKFLNGIFSRPTYAIGIFIAPIFTFVFLSLYEAVQKFANKYFFYTLYNYQKTINSLSQRLNYINDLDEIVNLIVSTVKQSMQLDKAGVVLVEEKDGAMSCKTTIVVGFKKDSDVCLLKNKFFIRYIKEKQKPVIKEELLMLARRSNDTEEAGELLKLDSDMKRIEVALCLPLTSSKKLKGIIILGPKISGDAYTKEDLELLNTLSYQAGIAIENAELYKEIQDFNKTLQQKVDEQTKEIRKAYEVEKTARQELEQLDKNKNQFLLTIQHHLRTPLTVMMGYSDLILNGAFGKSSKEIVNVTKKIQARTQELIKMVDEFLDVTQFKLGKEVISFEPGVKVENVLKDVVADLELEAQTKNISLKFKKNKKILPTVRADKVKLKAALFNIVDNAVKYTTEGGASITVDEKDNNILVVVKDTGIGIAKDRIDTLFDKTFERGEGAQKVFATGRGIGLYLAGQIIKSHGGKVWAQSDGAGKGSTFFVELPPER